MCHPEKLRCVVRMANTTKFNPLYRSPYCHVMDSCVWCKKTIEDLDRYDAGQHTLCHEEYMKRKSEKRCVSCGDALKEKEIQSQFISHYTCGAEDVSGYPFM